MSELGSLSDNPEFVSLIIDGTIPAKMGRPPLAERAMTHKERKQKYTTKKKADKLKFLAVLDFETDPFNEDSPEPVFPFCCEIYSDQFAPVVIWDDDYETLIEKVLISIESLPDSYTIYAHNGGKFDYMYFIHKLRGVVKFKGRAIMSARIGDHELRDSLHILPEKLSSWKKDKFDYQKMRRERRYIHKEEILKYLHSDCVYLFDFVKRFTQEFGLKISIGQAAFAELKKHYKITPIKEKMDTALREYFLGGRVECIAGLGHFDSLKYQKPYRLFDVNSMYPWAMAHRKHPISSEYVWHRGSQNENTCFLDLSCKSYGAFFIRGEGGELSAPDEVDGRFKTTIWEYETALRLGLIENVQIHWCIDNLQRSDFAKFILPMYKRREETKQIMKRLKIEGKEDSIEYEEIKKENIFLKYLLNNSYGKTAQNPRKYKEYCITDHGCRPEAKWFDFMKDASDDIRHEFGLPIERCSSHDIWARPNPGTRYNNVGTAASITGAARALLLEAKAAAIDPVYCDTDSLFCRDIPGFKLDPVELGAWDIEETFDEIIIVGKKTYVCKVSGYDDGHEKRLKVRSKGVDLRIRPKSFEPTSDEWRIANQATWQRYVDALDGKIISVMNAAPTFNKIGQQHFMTRRIRATAPIRGRVANAARISQNCTG